MKTVFKKLSLSEQVAHHLLRQINKGIWGEWLPQERQLAQELGISRATLRGALNQLKREGYLESRNCKGNRLRQSNHHNGSNSGSLSRSSISAASADSFNNYVTATASVNLLCPEQLDNEFYFIMFLTDRLRERFYRNNVIFNALWSRASYTMKPERFIGNILDKNPADIWIVYRATKPIQQWLSRQGIPCMLVGSAYDEFDLANVDADFEATCRHAGGRIACLGHRFTVYFMEEPELAGDSYSWKGFRDGIKAGCDTAKAELIKYENNTQLLVKARNLLERTERPTAFLVDEPEQYLLLHTYLLNNGWKVPDDISIICRKYMPEFQNVIPEPTCYCMNTTVFSKKVFTMALHILKETAYFERKVRIFPDYIKGGTLACKRSS